MFDQGGDSEWPNVGAEADTAEASAEEALRRSERNFCNLIESMPDAIAVHRGGKFVYVNTALVRLMGYDSADDIVGKPVLSVVHPDDRSVITERIASMMRTRQSAPPREERFIRHDGSIIVAEVVALPLEFEGRLAVVAIARDVTERRELTARAMQMDRIAAVGTLAASVGHEINNPLTYVSANIDFGLERLARLEQLLAQVDDDRPLDDNYALAAAEITDIRGLLKQARQGSQRIRDVVRTLKTFSRGDEEQLGPVSLHAVIDSAINMAANEVNHRAQLVRDFDDEVGNVYGNESQLGQVFLNLLVNAAHAIPMGDAAHNQITVRTRLEEDCVVIEVRDTGVGISETDMPQLFEPFFTTKPVGQGTGLGLSICRRIIQAHQGTITFESAPGGPTTFRVRLPATDDEITGEILVEGARPTRRGRILMIDDEPMIGNIVERTLRDEHDVETVTSGQAALACIEANPRYDIIFCDLMMPDMSGMDFYDTICVHFSDLADRMVFITGGAFTPQARDFLDGVTNRRVEKPFTSKFLRGVVREILAERDREAS